MDTVMSSLILLAAAVPVVLTLLAIFHPSRKLLWGHRIAATEAHGASPYRHHRTVKVEDLKEPRLVRATAILTALLGGMMAPGIFAALVGVVAIVVLLSNSASLHTLEELTILLVALSAPSGLVIAYRCARLYGPMLDHQEDVAARMRSLAKHSGIHNTALLAVYLEYCLSSGSDLAHLGWATYPVISLIHVGLLAAAARTIERRERETEEVDAVLADPATAWLREDRDEDRPVTSMPAL
jgi:hypothetical protein